MRVLAEKVADGGSFGFGEASPGQFGDGHVTGVIPSPSRSDTKQNQNAGPKAEDRSGPLMPPEADFICQIFHGKVLPLALHN